MNTIAFMVLVLALVALGTIIAEYRKMVKPVTFYRLFTSKPLSSASERGKSIFDEDGYITTVSSDTDFEALLKAYGCNVSVLEGGLRDGAVGLYDSKSKVVRVASLEDTATLVHEVQHALQDADGRANGTSPAYMEAYLEHLWRVAELHYDVGLDTDIAEKLLSYLADINVEDISYRVYRACPGEMEAYWAEGEDPWYGVDLSITAAYQVVGEKGYITKEDLGYMLPKGYRELAVQLQVLQ